MAEQARALPRLIVFTDCTRAPPAQILTRFAELARCARAGSVLFTVRDYGLSVRTRWELGIAISVLAARHEQRLGVADRADLARALSCHAFHLPESGLSAASARRLLGPEVLLSRGCHDPAQEPEPELDVQLLSPIFEPRKGRLALGPGVLAPAANTHTKPFSRFALGAVDAHNAAACLAAGAAGVAVIGAALAPDPAPLLRALGILRV